MSKKKSVKDSKSKPAEEEETVMVLTPEVTIDHDDSAFYIDVELPGVAKEHVQLSVGPQSVCVEAARDDLFYQGCFSLAHEVNENKAKAKFENGLLKIEIPLKAALKGKRIPIE